MKEGRVAITGMGAICGLGHNVEDIWKSAIQGKSGISTISQSPLDEKVTVKIAGEVKNFHLNEELLSPKEAPRFDRFIQFALHSTKEALADAGLLLESPYPRERMGALMGVGMGGFPLIENAARVYGERGQRRVSPFFIPSIIPNMAPGMTSIVFDLKGINYSISSACASSAHALAAACFEITSGRHDVIVSGGAESCISNLPISGFSNMKALSKRYDNPSEASSPFDISRDGFVMAEGAGILVLENYEKALARGATIYAELVGHGVSSDAHHITSPHPEGEGASRCMKAAIENAQISPSDIGYINAHGTSTPLGDLGETKAIHKTFGEHAQKLKISSTKSMTGHLLGAAGGIETIFCAKALYEGILPPTINLTNQDPQCDLDYIPNKSQKVQVQYALNNSFGFGGTNASVILKKV